MLQISPRTRSKLTVGIPAAVLAVGFVVGPLRSSEWSWRSPILSEVRELTALEPVRALPRTEAVIATIEAQRFLDADRPYAAWESLRGHLDEAGTSGVSANLIAARAAAAWGGWTEVKEVLKERDWLETAAHGEGLLLLAIAEEETGNPVNATDTYRRYLDVPTARQRGLALARLGSVLSGRDEHAQAAEAFASAATELPLIADWLKVFQVEELVEGGIPAATITATHMTGGSAAARQKRVQLEASAWETSADTPRAIARLEWEARILNAMGSRAEAGYLHLDRAHLLLGSGRVIEGRSLLAAIAGATSLTSDVRLSAAKKIDDLGGGSADEHMGASDAYAAAGEPGLAARSLRAAFGAGATDTPEARLRLARLLYEERDFGPARVAFDRAAGMLDDRELRAEAELYAARSLFRSGGSSRTQATQKANALATFRRITAEYAGTPAAGTAFFILGDEAATTASALSFYRRAAEITSSPDAREALNRVGDRSLKLNNPAAAIEAWEKYVDHYPRGEETARVAYQVARMHATAGRDSRARSMYNAAMRAEPTSYYGVRSAERRDVDSLEETLDEPRPWTGLASEPGEMTDVLRRMDLLAEIGATDARAAELESAIRHFAGRELALITLAEGLRDRKDAVKSINLGRSLLTLRDGQWDERLLKIVFPFPYREIIEAEARRRGLDPILLAALVRQESSFRADAESWVGAKGLGQIMPATGRGLAGTLGIRNYGERLLEVPEVNVRMAAKYLGDLMNRFDDASDLALSGYNAGPSRAVTWRRTLRYGRDTDAFRAAIPFDETRNYVMLVSRNRAIYQQLYGE